MESTSHICSIIPFYLLESMAESDNEEIRNMATYTLQCDAKIHEERHACMATSIQDRYGPGHGHGDGDSAPPPQGIVPDYVHSHIADGPGTDNAIREASSATIGISAATREERQKVIADDSAATAVPPLIEGTWHRQVFDMEGEGDPDFPGFSLPGTLVRDEGDAPVADQTVNETYDNTKIVLDFYKTMFGWNSINGSGMPVKSSVHFGRMFGNAFWNGRQMVYGDGSDLIYNFTKAIDVIGHEITHGVVQYNGGLEYLSESGALNEHIADVFGIMIKQYVEDETADQADWLIGEGILRPGVKGVALRNMKMPGTAYKDPVLGTDLQPDHVSKMESLRTSPATAAMVQRDGGGVHIFSGIPNRAFYLVATHFGGYSWEKAGRIWWRALSSRRLPPRGATFVQFADITVDVTNRLFGRDDAKAVREAWGKVGVERDI